MATQCSESKLVFYELDSRMENRIKEQQLNLFADRTSSHQMQANRRARGAGRAGGRSAVLGRRSLAHGTRCSAEDEKRVGEARPSESAVHDASRFAWCQKLSIISDRLEVPQWNG